MLEQGKEGHIVNTASTAGLIAGPGLGTYKTTKHAVVSLSETLYHELAQVTSSIKVSVLCPSFTNTGINQSSRNRPAHLRNNPADEETDQHLKATTERMQQGNDSGMDPSELADRVFKAIVAEDLYVLTHPEVKPRIERRMTDILNGRNPTLE
jgi:short-subunit dehydrogenase